MIRKFSQTREIALGAILIILPSACAHHPAVSRGEGPEATSWEEGALTRSTASGHPSRGKAPAPDQRLNSEAAPASSRSIARAAPAAGRSPASNPADFALFNGAYVLAGTRGNRPKCDESLDVSTDFSQDQGLSRVQLTPNYALDVGSASPQPSSWGPNPACDYFTDDELTDNYDTLTEKGQQIQPTDPQWEINRSYSKRCGRSSIPTFSGFDTWYFTPHGQSGGPEITRHTIFGAEYQCFYRTQSQG